jgi:predicted dehydrogenase
MGSGEAVMSTETLRIGMIGAGGIAKKRHLPALAAIPDVAVVAVCNSRVESAQSIAAEFGIAEVIGSWADLVARPDVDIIWIGTPPLLHAPITIAALEAGKHVFCQARMAMTLAEGRAMLTAAQARPELVTMLCPSPQGMKGEKLFKQLLAERYVGDPWHFRFVADSGFFSDPAAPAHWRQRTELSGDNVLNVGIFGEVLQRWLGSPERLQAQMKVSVPERDGYTVHIPDIVQAFGLWPGNLPGTLEFSGVAQFAEDHLLTIYGSAGTLVYNFTKDRIFGARRGDAELQPIEIPPQMQTGWSVERDFIHAVRHFGRPEPSFATGVQNLVFSDALNRSAKSGQTVVLN